MLCSFLLDIPHQTMLRSHQQHIHLYKRILLFHSYFHPMFCCHHSTQLISSFFSTNLLTFSLLTSSVHTQEVNEEYLLTGLCYHIPIPSKFIGTRCCTIIQEFSRKIKINARFSVSWIQSRKIMTNLWSKMSCMHNHPKSVQKEPTWAVASSMLTANFHWHPLCKSHLST